MIYLHDGMTEAEAWQAVANSGVDSKQRITSIKLVDGRAFVVEWATWDMTDVGHPLCKRFHIRVGNKRVVTWEEQ